MHSKVLSEPSWIVSSHSAHQPELSLLRFQVFNLNRNWMGWVSVVWGLSYGISDRVVFVSFLLAVITSPFVRRNRACAIPRSSARYAVRLRPSVPSQAAHTSCKALSGHDLISIVVFFMNPALARPVSDLVPNSFTVASRPVVVCSQFV